MLPGKTSRFEVVQSPDGTVIRMSPRFEFRTFRKQIDFHRGSSVPQSGSLGRRVARAVLWMLWRGGVFVVLMLLMANEIHSRQELIKVASSLFVLGLGFELLGFLFGVVYDYLYWRKYHAWQVLIRRPQDQQRAAAVEVCFAGRTLQNPRRLERQQCVDMHLNSGSESTDGSDYDHWAALTLAPPRGVGILDLPITTLKTNHESVADQEGAKLEAILRRELALPGSADHSDARSSAG